MNFKGKGSYLNGEGLKFPKSALKAVINPALINSRLIKRNSLAWIAFVNKHTCIQITRTSIRKLSSKLVTQPLLFFWNAWLDWTWFFFRGGKGGKFGEKSGSSSRIYHRPSLPGTLWWCRPPTQGYRIAIHHSEVPGDDGRWKIRLKSAVAVKSPIQIPASLGGTYPWAATKTTSKTLTTGTHTTIILIWGLGSTN